MEQETTAPSASTEAIATEAPAAAAKPIISAQGDAASSLLERAQELVDIVLTPGWRQYQVLMLVGLIAASYVLRVLTEDRINEWMRTRVGWPKWRLRLFIQLRQRLTLIYFTTSIWILYGVMQEATWPARSYLIGVFATLALAWLVIALVSRLVKTRTLRRFVRWSLWVFATLAALDLLEGVEAFLEGIAVSFGPLNISVLAVIQAIILIAVMLTAARLGTQALAAGLRRNQDISPSMQVLAIKAIQVLLYGIVFMVGIRALGFDLTGLALLSGAVGVGIGFGLGKVVSNLVSGIIILLDRSIKPGDVISLGNTFGWIDSLGARYVAVVTRDGKGYLIPNEDLITNQVVNWTHSDEFVRLDIPFGTSYHNDPHLVRKIAIAAAERVPRVLSGKHAPVCHMIGFGDSSVDYTLRFWIRDITGGMTNVKGNVFLSLWDAFAENDISILFPQREVRVLNESVPVHVRHDDD